MTPPNHLHPAQSDTTNMAKKFFPDEWEKLSKEEMINARARLSGFIESTNEKEKTIRDVSKTFYEIMKWINSYHENYETKAFSQKRVKCTPLAKNYQTLTKNRNMPSANF